MDHASKEPAASPESLRSAGCRAGQTSTKPSHSFHWEIRLFKKWPPPRRGKEQPSVRNPLEGGTRACFAMELLAGDALRPWGKALSRSRHHSRGKFAARQRLVVAAPLLLVALPASGTTPSELQTKPRCTKRSVLGHDDSDLLKILSWYQDCGLL